MADHAVVDPDQECHMGLCRHCGNRPRGAKLVALAKRTDTAAGSRNFPAADRGAPGLPSKTEVGNIPGER
jgi:hypothetical protein